MNRPKKHQHTTKRHTRIWLPYPHPPLTQINRGNLSHDARRAQEDAITNRTAEMTRNLFTNAARELTAEVHWTPAPDDTITDGWRYAAGRNAIVRGLMLAADLTPDPNMPRVEVIIHPPAATAPGPQGRRIWADVTVVEVETVWDTEYVPTAVRRRPDAWKGRRGLV